MSAPFAMNSGTSPFAQFGGMGLPPFWAAPGSAALAGPTPMPPSLMRPQMGMQYGGVAQAGPTLMHPQMGMHPQMATQYAAAQGLNQAPAGYNMGHREPLGAGPAQMPSCTHSSPADEFVVSELPGCRGLVAQVESPLGRAQLFAQLSSGGRERLQEVLEQRGALLFRNCGLSTAEDFAQLSQYFTDGVLRDYRDGISPRTRVLEGVYTSTEYPPDHDMALHNEMSYNPFPPRHIAFFCESSPASGGQTPIASSREILARMPNGIRERFAPGIRYVVNSPSQGCGPGVPWQAMYEAESREEVEAVCRELGVMCEWKADGTLRTTRTAPATQRHPRHDFEVWFNHAHLFHPSDLPERTQRALPVMYGSQADYPKNAFLADGSEISHEDLAEVRRVLQECTVTFPWQRGDCLILDNYQVCHGRRSFDRDATPKRKILAALLF